VKNPWLSYTLIRLGMFFGIFFLFLLLNFNPYFAAIIAAVVSFSLSISAAAPKPSNESKP
jgi:hypothetical protein